MCTNINLDNMQIKIHPCDPTIATELLALMKEKNLDDFVSILNNNIFNIDHYYDAPENGTLLEIACRSYGYSDFVKVLIAYGAGGISKRNSPCNGQINQVENFNSDWDELDDACDDDGCYNGCSNQFTYLQYACNLGLVDVVNDLLKMGFNPNEHFLSNPETPIKIAARNGYHEIVSMLLDSPEIRLQWADIKAILESLLDHIFGLKNVPCSMVGNVDLERDYYKCLEYILKKILHVSVTKAKVKKPQRKAISRPKRSVEL